MWYIYFLVYDPISLVNIVFERTQALIPKMLKNRLVHTIVYTLLRNIRSITYGTTHLQLDDKQVDI